MQHKVEGLNIKQRIFVGSSIYTEFSINTEVHIHTENSEIVGHVDSDIELVANVYAEGKLVAQEEYTSKMGMKGFDGLEQNILNSLNWSEIEELYSEEE